MDKINIYVVLYNSDHFVLLVIGLVTGESDGVNDWVSGLYEYSSLLRVLK